MTTSDQKRPPGRGENRDPKITLMRKAITAATTAHGIGGRKKERGRPKPTLPKLKCLDQEPTPGQHKGEE